MPYPEQLVRPMREELTRVGISELLDAEAVDAAFSDSDGKTLFVTARTGLYQVRTTIPGRGFPETGN